MSAKARRRYALAAGIALVCTAVTLGIASAGSASEAAPRHAAAGVKLIPRNVHFKRTSIGGLIFFGELVNSGSRPAADVGLLVELYNDRGERLARGATLKTSANVLRPGRKAFWETQMTDNPKKWSRTKIKAVEQIGAESALEYDYTGFKVSGLKLAEENPGFSQALTGKVTNTGGKPSRVGAVVVALYAPGGRLAAVTDQGFLYPYSSKQVVPPGKSAPFKATILGSTKKPAKIVVQVRASTKDEHGFYLP